MSAQLSFWKRKSKKFAAHLVFWPIIAVFVIFGFERFGDSTGGAAATVNGHSITVAEYRSALQRMIDFYSQITGGQFDEAAQKKYRVRETALQQLVSSELVAQEAKEMGLKVTDQELTEIITGLAYFKKDGKFSKDAYDIVLKNNRLTSHQFEAGLRKETLVDKTRQIFEKNVYAGPLEKNKQDLLQSQKINLEFLKFDPTKALENTTVTSADIEKIKQQKDGALKVKEFYDLNSRLFNSPEQVKAKHILIKAQKGDAAQEKQALEKINKILVELKKSSFDTLANKYTDDPGSKGKGGELGWFEKGRMVPEFEQAAFTTPAGQISKPVQTQFGFHIIKVEDKKAAKNTSLQSATPEIEKKLAAKMKIEDAIKEVQTLLASNPEAAVKKLRSLDGTLNWKETGLFSISEDIVPLVGGGDDVMREALTLTMDKPQSNKLLTTQEGYVLLKLKKSEKVAADKNPAAGLGRSFSKDVFSSWATKLNEKAKINVNPKLFDGEISSEPL